MPSLLDIAPPEISGKEVDIRGVKLPLLGVTAEQWAKLYARFPELRQIVAGRGDDKADSMRLLRAQCALIAAGTGYIGDRAIERAALKNLTDEEQRSIMQDIMRLSLPGDMFIPLLDEEDGEEGGNAPAQSTEVSATKSRKR